MMRYTTYWTRIWCLAGALGVGLAFLVWPAGGVLGIFVTAFLCSGVLVLLLSPGTANGHGVSVLWWLRVLTRAGLCGGAAVGVGALVATMPYLVAPVLLAAVLSSPWVVERVVSAEPRGRRAASAPGDAVIGSGPAAPTAVPGAADRAAHADVSCLTDQELCRRWRAGFIALQSAGSAAERAALVALRQECLDELERRRPAAMAAWLASGARASGGPERFLAADTRGSGHTRDDHPDAA